MAETSVGYKCPNCSAPLTFLPGHDKVTCEYCGTELEVKTIEEMYAAKEAAAAAAQCQPQRRKFVRHQPRKAQTVGVGGKVRRCGVALKPRRGGGVGVQVDGHQQLCAAVFGKLCPLREFFVAFDMNYPLGAPFIIIDYHP